MPGFVGPVLSDAIHLRPRKRSSLSVSSKYSTVSNVVSPVDGLLLVHSATGSTEQQQQQQQQLLSAGPAVHHSPSSSDQRRLLVNTDPPSCTNSSSSTSNITRKMSKIHHTPSIIKSSSSHPKKHRNPSIVVSVSTAENRKQSCLIVPQNYVMPISDDRGGVKWPEDIGPGGDGDGAEAGDPTRDQPKTLKGKLSKGLKILLPHVGLTTLLLSYIAGGAVIFQWLETKTEMDRRKRKIQNELWDKLINLSLTHEYDEKFAWDAQLWQTDPNEIKTRWTFQAAVLYALTVITTTGYDHISPLTDSGRLFTVFFGLFGIPLMFITAADIGKFLSECVTTLYAKFLQLSDYIRDKIMAPICRLICPSKRRRRNSSTPGGEGGIAPNGDLVQKDALDPLGGVEDLGRVQLPIVAYFCLILGYCAIGSFMFTQWERGPIWSFIHGFFFSFNTITTIGLGNIRVFNVLYLLLIVCYVIVGLAVITMCVDLASSQLKVFFTRLHYFGRKFRGARALMNMSDDIKEAMKIIHALKRTRSDGKNGPGITLEDIKQFLEIEQKYSAQPYVPRNINFLRWVDDEEASSARSGSLSLKHVSSDPALHM